MRLVQWNNLDYAMYGVRQDIAGKTGTTQNSADNWFIAMTPHLVMGSWVIGESQNSLSNRPSLFNWARRSNGASNRRHIH